MKSINRTDFIETGKVLKSHGVAGEIKVFLETAPIEWAFLELQGKPVPFKVLRTHHTHHNEYLMQLQGITHPAQTEELIGATVLSFQPKSEQPQEDLDESIIGFEVIDKTLGSIGTVSALHEMPMQWLLEVKTTEKEHLIPAVKPIIQSINYSRKTIRVKLPEGLLEL
jgi:16S rRNA processing protein RimM